MGVWTFAVTLAAAAVGAALFRASWQRALLSVRRRAVKLLERTAEEAARAHQRRIDARVAQLAKERRVAEGALQRRRVQLEEHQRDVTEWESHATRREIEVQSAEAAAQALVERADEGARDVRLGQTQIRELLARLSGTLEACAGITGERLVALSVADEVGRIEHEHRARAHELDAMLERHGAARARHVLSSVLARFDAVGHLERIYNTTRIEDAALLEAGREDAWLGQILRRSAGCELLVDAQKGTLTVRGDDPLGREIGRRIMARVVAEHLRRPAEVQELAESLRRDIEQDVEQAGQSAFALLDLEPAHPEVNRLVGRLKYRLSYSQNQWKHAVEVARLAGMIAVEMGLDSGVARRGGLLHDIGKALTHEREGSHAVLGAEVARRCGESEAVANAIGAHHQDEPFATPYAHIVAAADAVSGARPGARRESATHYVQMVEKICQVAKASSRAVSRVDIMQGGREVRVSVAGIDEGPGATPAENPVPSGDELIALAETIARNVEREVTFAGQVRIVVIQESRAVAVAP